MKESSESSQSQCLNCGATVNGDFCHRCGQRTRDNSDRSLSRLLGEFLGNIFFIDNRFFLSISYIIRFPGRMTVEFLEGKRKKFISPVTLFLFVNLIYFLVSPLSDFSPPLVDQVNSLPYSSWAKTMVEEKLQTEGIELRNYAITYQNMSDDISKSIMIINVPMIAFFVYLMVFKKRRFYFDSLIFAFHFFTLLLASWVMLDWVLVLNYNLFGVDSPVASTLSSRLFLVIIPVVYAIFSMKKFINIRWYWVVPAGFGVLFAAIATSLIYRFIVFLFTFWLT